MFDLLLFENEGFGMAYFLLYMGNGLGMIVFLLFMGVIGSVMGDGLGMFDFLLVVLVGWLMVWYVFGFGGLVMQLLCILFVVCIACLVWQYQQPWCSVM